MTYNKLNRQASFAIILHNIPLLPSNMIHEVLFFLSSRSFWVQFSNGNKLPWKTASLLLLISLWWYSHKGMLSVFVGGFSVHDGWCWIPALAPYELNLHPRISSESWTIYRGYLVNRLKWEMFLGRVCENHLSIYSLIIWDNL